VAEQTLELRGIRLTHLIDYLKELGAEPRSSDIPMRFEGPGWRADILEETEIRFTPIFAVNAVKIRFAADTDEQLAAVVRAYRTKTFRAGG